MITLTLRGDEVEVSYRGQSAHIPGPLFAAMWKAFADEVATEWVGWPDETPPPAVTPLTPEPPVIGPSVTVGLIDLDQRRA